MRAIVFRSFGGPEVLQVAEVPTPEPAAGQLRIRVQAATVNPVDLVTRSGLLTEIGVAPEQEVYGLGWDVAGTVDALGPGVTGFSRGDRVVGLVMPFGVPTGAQAEYLVLDAAAAAAAPAGASPADAATLPLNALTASQALDLLGLTEGQSLLVIGAAGAVGGYAVQLGKVRGLRVVAVAGDRDRQQAGEFGADHFVPRTADLATAVREYLPGGVDGVLDTALLGAAALPAVRDGGAFVAVTDPAQPEPVRGIRTATVHVQPDGAALAELSRLAGTGRLSLRTAATYPFQDVATAHKRLAEGGVRGRLVLVP